MIEKSTKKASKHQKEWGNSLISKLSLSGNEEILDLGCGNGSLIDFPGAFDVIFSYATLHWIKGHNRLLKNSYDSVLPKLKTQHARRYGVTHNRRRT